MTAKQLGKLAEEFFQKYGPWLVENSVNIFRKKNPNSKEEGADGIGISIIGGNANEEDKGMQSYLTRDNDHGEMTGTIPFEIFHAWPNQYNRLTLEDLYAGWLLSVYHPEEYRQIIDLTGKQKQAKKPGLYAFMLYDSGRIFASIVFEDVPALLNRLRELCPDPENWGINDLRQLRPATDRVYWEQYAINNPNIQPKKNNWYWNNQHGGRIQNMWHIPLSSLEDLATVTIIKPFWSFDQNSIAAHRYAYLYQLATRRGTAAIFDPATHREPNEHFSYISLSGEKLRLAKIPHELNPEEVSRLFPMFVQGTDGITCIVEPDNEE